MTAADHEQLRAKAEEVLDEEWEFTSGRQTGWLSTDAAAFIAAANASTIRDLCDEVEALRQGIWDAYAILGFDTDGDAIPAAHVHPPLDDLMRQAAREARDDYEESMDESDRAEAARDAWRADADQLAAALEHFGQWSPCPCGAWLDRPTERPHVTGCPVGNALDAHRALVGRDRTAPTTEETP